MHGKSNILTVCDTDTMPIMASVNAATIEAAKSIRDTLMISPKALQDYFNLDFDDPQNDELRQDVWATGNVVNLTHPEKNAALVPGTKTGGEADGKSPAKTPKDARSGEGTASTPSEKKSPRKSLDHASKLRLRKVEKVFRKLREMSLQAVDDGAVWSLDDANKAAADALGDALPAVEKGIASAYLDVEYAILDDDADADAKKEAVRVSFNAKDRRYLRTLLGL
jgi:hypothetical protein